MPGVIEPRRLARAIGPVLATMLTTAIFNACGQIQPVAATLATTTTSSTLRSRPEVDADVLAVLPPGERVTIVGRAGAWREVFVHGATGFVAVQHLRVVRSRILPRHAAILESAGWLTFVNDNVDRVDYRPVDVLDTSAGPAVGLATVVNGQRVAVIMTRDRSDFEIAATLAHEAAHLEGIAKTGQMFSQEYAYHMERRFRQAARGW